MAEKGQSELAASYNFEGGQPIQHTHCSSKRRGLLVSILVGCYIGYWCASTYDGKFNSGTSNGKGSEYGLAPNPDPELIWQKLASNKNLTWEPCYENGAQCAKFAVPLDYGNPSGPEASVALIKIPSRIPLGEEGYRGPILFNPGGPGGSGVDMIRGRGKLFQKIIGDDYDIIGFDPRGVGRTEPQIVVFPERAEREVWQLNSPPPLNSTPDALARTYARSVIYGSLAQQRVPDAAQYVSTAFVSRDMLAISRAHGYDKLQYWGFSYGTILGATFAAMFPDNVGRLIIDGVADAPDYYKAQWSINLRDTDATLRWFTDGCAEAGPEGCALYEDSKNKVAARVDRLFTKLKKNPIAVPLPKDSSEASDYGIVDYGLVRGIVFQWLYKPYNSGSSANRTISASKLANILAAADNGDGLPAWNAQKAGLPSLKCECPGAPKAAPLGDAHLAIACTDGEPVTDTLEELQEHFDTMSKYSSFADLWALREQCAGWNIRPKERFAGPFIGNTSFPLLIIGNTADPVTPLYNAHKAAEGFKDAVVLTQNSPGHCSLAATSTCTLKHVRDYFRDGKVPKAGITCETEDTLFETAKKVQTASFNKEDQEFFDAVRELSDSFEPPRFPSIGQF